MTFEDAGKYRANIKQVILEWCESAGIDATNPEQVSACSKPLWIALEESGKLHPDMTYQGFCEGIRYGAFINMGSIYVRVNL